MHLPAMREKPAARDPVKHQRTNEQKRCWTRVEFYDLLAVHVQCEHRHRHEAAHEPQRGHENEVGSRVAAVFHLGTVLLLERLQFLKPFHQRETQENEHRENEQPRRHWDGSCDVTGDEANRVKRGEKENIRHRNLLYVPGVSHGHNEVADEHNGERNGQEERDSQCHDEQKRRAEQTQLKWQPPLANGRPCSVG